MIINSIFQRFSKSATLEYSKTLFLFVMGPTMSAITVLSVSNIALGLPLSSVASVFYSQTYSISSVRHTSFVRSFAFPIYSFLWLLNLAFMIMATIVPLIPLFPEDYYFFSPLVTSIFNNICCSTSFLQVFCFVWFPLHVTSFCILTS